MQMKDIQEEILENKRRHNFNTTDIEQEFCYLYGEIREAHEANSKKLNTLGEELADVTNFLMGIAEIKKIDLATEILKKLAKAKNYVFYGNTGIVMKMEDFDTGEAIQMKDIQKQTLQGKQNIDIEKMFCDVYDNVGEAYEAYYKGLNNFEEKLAEVAISLMRIAEIKGIDLGSECVKKVEKNKTRVYKKNEMGYMVHL